MKVGDLIKEYIVEHSISVREFSRRANLSNTYISNLVNGADKNPSLEAIGKIATVMGLTSQQLFDKLDGNQSFKINSRKPKKGIPLYASISCGYGIFVDDEVLEYLSIPDQFLNPHNEYFACTAHGDSMEGKGINDGDILVFEKAPSLNNGEIGSFCIDENEAVCKTYRRLSSGIVLLESANEKYAPIEVDISNECFRILGKYKFKFSIEQE